MNAHQKQTIVIQMPTALTLLEHSNVLANMDIVEMVLIAKVKLKLFSFKITKNGNKTFLWL